jgi:hypothetical protein
MKLNKKNIDTYALLLAVTRIFQIELKSFADWLKVKYILANTAAIIFIRSQHTCIRV